MQLPLEHSGDHRSALLRSRRRDSTLSINSNTSNLSKYSVFTQGKICITLEVDSMRYLRSSDEYDIRFSDTSIISLDIVKKQIRCKIKSQKIKHIQEELDDDEISSILDDIDYDIDVKPEPDSTPKYVMMNIHFSASICCWVCYSF